MNNKNTKQTKKVEEKEKDLIEKILDENNDDNIFITNEETNELIEFEQVATITDNGIVYAILSPTISNDDFDAGEGIVFKIIKDGEDDILVVENDEKTFNRIFDIYEDMYKKEYGGNFIETIEEE